MAKRYDGSNMINHLSKFDLFLQVEIGKAALPLVVRPCRKAWKLI